MKKSSTFDDPILGSLEFLHDRMSCWSGNIKTDNGGVQIEVAGDATKPNPKLIAAARNLASSFNEFEIQMSEYLESEKRIKKGIAHEIAKLQVESIIFSWRDKPDDALVYFKSPDPDKIWRCDYLDKKLSGLVFDN